jgi:hypothetical protein
MLRTVCGVEVASPGNASAKIAARDAQLDVLEIIMAAMRRPAFQNM